MFDKLKAYGFQALALALGVLLLVQTGRLQADRVAHQKLIATTAGAALQRSEAARAYETKTAGKEAAHAQATQENSDAFTTSQPVRDAIARADLATADRLRTDAERRAATYRAQAQACTTASGDIADRLEAFDRQLVEGVAVVGELRADLARRDAEVVLLRRQVDIERALTTP